MFKHSFCGGKHASIKEARDCQYGPRVMSDPGVVTGVDSPPLAKLKAEATVRAQTPVAKIRFTPVSDGFYRTPGGMYYKVLHAIHGSGHPYAKRMRVVQEAVRGTDGAILQPALIAWDFDKGMQFRLQEEWKLSVEDAGGFGKLYGCCLKCGTPLTDEESIARGIGPVCAGLRGGKKTIARNLKLWKVAV